jgi:hypothetical protein
VANNDQSTDGFFHTIRRRPKRGQGERNWRTVEPTPDVLEALADFRDLCFRPPADPHAPNQGNLGSNSAVAGQALAALEPLYDPARMRQAMDSGNFYDGVHLVQTALAALLCMQKNPDRHLYKPLSDADPPSRDPAISLDKVLSRLLTALQRDFQPEIDAIKRHHDAYRSDRGNGRA